MEDDFRSWLRTQLRNRDMTAADLTRRSGFPSGTLSRWLNGSRRPSVEACYTLADVLGLPVSYVLHAAGHPTVDEPDTATEQEDRVVAMLRKLSPDSQQAVLEFVEYQFNRERRADERVGS